MQTKKCPTCNEIKSVDSFYRDTRKPDGLYASCKICHNIRVARWQRTDNGKKSTLNRVRKYQASEKGITMLFTYKGTAAYKDSVYRKSKRYYSANSKKKRAHNAVYNAIKAGKLTKGVCFCGGTVVQAHHDDYDKPLAVRWLCNKHHKEHHYRSKEKFVRKDIFERDYERSN